MLLLLGQATVCCQDKLKARKDVLRKYLRNDVTLEVQALFALQQIYVKYNEPAGTFERLKPYYCCIYSSFAMNFQQENKPMHLQFDYLY